MAKSPSSGSASWAIPWPATSQERAATTSPSTTARRQGAEAWVAEHRRHAPRRRRPPRRADADFVFSCVGNDDDLRAVTLGARRRLRRHRSPAPSSIDNTTASADVARELARRRQSKGVGFLDAPVSGGQAGAENGPLTVMVGGDQDDLRQGRAGDRRLRQDGRADRAGRRRPAHQDGQPDLHRRRCPGPRRGHPLRQAAPASTSRRSSTSSPRARRNPGRWRTAGRP